MGYSVCATDGLYVSSISSKSALLFHDNNMLDLVKKKKEKGLNKTAL